MPLVPTVLRGNPYGCSIRLGLYSHLCPSGYAGAWERGGRGYALVPTVLRGNPYGRLISPGLHSTQERGSEGDAGMFRFPRSSGIHTEPDRRQALYAGLEEVKHGQKPL
jgi:hypothetical protein